MSISDNLKHFLQPSYSLIFIAVYAMLTAVIVWRSSKGSERFDRALFWMFGTVLIAFTALHPPELSRDGVGYIVDIVPNVCGARSCDPAASWLRDTFWYGSVSILKPLVGADLVVFFLAAIGIAIKLWVIDKLCKQRMLALLLLIPLGYIQYDFTQMRAAFALSWYFLGILLIAKDRFFASLPVVGTSFLWHAQALPAVAVYPAYWVNRGRYVVPLAVTLALLLLVVGIYPSVQDMQTLNIKGMGAEGYIKQTILDGGSQVKIFPLGYLPITAYGVWVLLRVNHGDRLNRVVGAGMLIAIFSAWFFASIPVMQGRMFEFFVVPIVLLSGNIGSNRQLTFGTIVLGWLLYFRLEILHDWILG